MKFNMRWFWFPVFLIFINLGTGCTFFRASHGDDDVKTSKHPQLIRTGLNRVEILPVSLGNGLSKNADADNIRSAVHRFLLEAVEQYGYQVVSSDERSSDLKADGLLSIHVFRYTERVGGAAASNQPASVHLRLSLCLDRSGQEIWYCTFNRTQEPLFSDVTRGLQYPGRGTRWLLVEEYAKYAVEQMVKTLSAEYPSIKK